MNRRRCNWATLLALLPPWAGAKICHLFDVRFAGLALSRIGHEVAEPELFIKEGQLGLRKVHRCEILLAPPAEVANQHFMKYWEPYFHLVRDPDLCVQLKSLQDQPGLRLPRSHYVEALNETAAFPKIHELWGARPPLLKLCPEDNEALRHQLSTWGLSRDDWFVCVHCREAGFVNESFHDFRNARIENFFPAIEEITARGGWVIRMGDPTMAKLPSLPKVIDYANSPAKSEQLDVALCAGARFLLGTSSGLSMLASVFGVPCALTNHAPLGVTLSYAPQDIGIPKLVWSRRERRVLSFPEVFNSPAANFRFAELFEQAGLELIENTPEEILGVCREMLAQLDGRHLATADDEANQRRFTSLLRPGHYTFGSRARIGRDFLRQHETLLAGQVSPAS